MKGTLRKLRKSLKNTGSKIWIQWGFERRGDDVVFVPQKQWKAHQDYKILVEAIDSLECYYSNGQSEETQEALASLEKIIRRERERPKN